jgi:hypothetical protein
MDRLMLEDFMLYARVLQESQDIFLHPIPLTLNKTQETLSSVGSTSHLNRFPRFISFATNPR